MDLDPKKIIRSFKKKGFLIENGTKHNKVIYEKSKAITTAMSKGSGQLGSVLISMMSRDLHITKDQFIDLVNCPLSKEELFQIYNEKGYINKKAALD